MEATQTRVRKDWTDFPDRADDCSVTVLIWRGLHHESPVDDHVDALHREYFTPVSDRHADFASDRVMTLSQLALERHHVDVLEKAVAERVVDRVVRADDRACQRFVHDIVRDHATA